ncbi:MAG: hypothetical protein ABIH42_04785, partial [Planctomycetota bacterium]
MIKVKIEYYKYFILKISVGAGLIFLLWGYSAGIIEDSAKLTHSNSRLAEEIEEKKALFINTEETNLKKNKILKEEFIPNIKNQIEFPDSLEQP